ncbi:hypothetical protein CTEN210_09102 [Chaetoceros tenuissimus]|uniref:Uncharacterized protein n=1 Tax=Chaetoceros tenuissimus TaxID=426638 RepID=A0AAD3CWU7_9STRA|nr:hypothetical protein CTEN210_09102 [Chaetoceros tenuissimus]
MRFDGSIMSQDVYKEEGGLGFDDDSVAPSLTSESLLSGCSDGTKVPFQELIDLAVKFMRRVPPRKVLDISRKYFDADTIHELLDSSNVVNMLHEPQAWATAPFIESDISSKRRKKNASKSQEVQTKSGDLKSKKNRLALESAYPHSIIASGIGPDGDGDVIRRRKRRKLLRTSAIVVGVLSIVLGMVDRGFMRLPLGLTGIQRADANPTETIVGHRSSSSDTKAVNTRENPTAFITALQEEEVMNKDDKSASSYSSEDEDDGDQTLANTSIEKDAGMDTISSTSIKKKERLQGAESIQSPKQLLVKQSYMVQTFLKDTLEKIQSIDKEELRRNFVEDAKTIVNAARYALDEDAEVVVL